MLGGSVSQKMKKKKKNLLRGTVTTYQTPSFNFYLFLIKHINIYYACIRFIFAHLIANLT